MIRNSKYIMISAVVAIDEKNGMGKNGGIPWHIPGEQKRFKEITTPHPMIMGRKTFESIGRILPNRPHIIVSRDPQYQVEGATITSSVADAIEKARKLEELRIKSQASGNSQDHNSLFVIHNSDESEAFIIGGGQIFKDSMQYITRIYLTLVHNDFHCDTFFPDYSQFTKVVEREERHDWDYPYTFLTLERP